MNNFYQLLLNQLRSDIVFKPDSVVQIEICCTKTCPQKFQFVADKRNYLIKPEFYDLIILKVNLYSAIAEIQEKIANLVV